MWALSTSHNCSSVLKLHTNKDHAPSPYTLAPPTFPPQPVEQSPKHCSAIVRRFSVFHSLPSLMICRENSLNNRGNDRNERRGGRDATRMILAIRTWETQTGPVGKLRWLVGRCRYFHTCICSAQVRDWEEVGRRNEPFELGRFAPRTPPLIPHLAAGDSTRVPRTW